MILFLETAKVHNFPKLKQAFLENYWDKNFIVFFFIGFFFQILNYAFLFIVHYKNHLDASNVTMQIKKEEMYNIILFFYIKKKNVWVIFCSFLTSSSQGLKSCQSESAEKAILFFCYMPFPWSGFSRNKKRYTISCFHVFVQC